MSEPPPTPPGAPPDDDRDGDVIDRLDDGLPPRSPDEATARAPYERVIDRIRHAPAFAPPPGAEARAAARLRAARVARRRRLVVGGVVAVLAIAAVLVLLLRPRPPAAARLQVAMLDTAGVVKRGPPAAGDRLRARTGRALAHTELRVYLATRLLARCPGDPACRITSSIVEVEVTTPAPGTYRVVGLSSASAIPPPGEGGLDGDLLDLRGAGVVIDGPTEIQIRP